MSEIHSGRIMEHECKLVFEPICIARPWGVFCHTCQKLLGACTSQKDAADVLANHRQWMAVRDDFEREGRQ